MKKNKITIKLIKYFFGIISIVVILCFVFAWIFLSKFYSDNEYDSLKRDAQIIYQDLKNNEIKEYSSISAFIIKDSSIVPVTDKKKRIMNSMVNEYELKDKGIINDIADEGILYYKLSTEIGDIVVFKSIASMEKFLDAVYLTLVFIFLFAILISIPLITYLGRKFTRPILQLKEVSNKISEGVYDVKIDISTKDEIEELSKSIGDMNENLKKKDTMQREFIANVSHDFKTPLSIIRNYSEAIADDMVDEQESKIYSKRIIHQVDKLNDLVMDILNLSKLQDRKVILNKSNFDIFELISACSRDLYLKSKSKNIDIDIQAGNYKIYADFKMLRRVLVNFLDNAIKFSYDNSKVIIKTTKIGESIKVSVINFGECICEEDLKNIWDKYYKNAMKGGMGLGLQICSEILLMHGFKYGVNSELDKGTEFFFIIEQI